MSDADLVSLVKAVSLEDPELLTAAASSASHARRREMTDVLSETLRRSNQNRHARQPSLLMDLGLGMEDSFAVVKNKPVVANMTFSSVSLNIVWAVSLFAGLVCFALAEVNQELYPHFPFNFFLVLGAHLFVLCTLLCYLLGVNRYGYNKYKLYQPFQGGQGFVLLQSFGVLCITMGVLSIILYGVNFDVKHVHKGVITTASATAALGNALLLRSLRRFQPYDRDGSAQLKSLKERTVLDILRRRPNQETAIVAALLVAEVLIGYLPHKVPHLRGRFAQIIFVIHIVCGAVIHFLIGHKYTPHYHLFTTKMKRGVDLFSFSTMWVFYCVATGASLYTINAANEVVDNGFIALVVGNALCCALLLLFIRTTPFNPTTTPGTPQASPIKEAPAVKETKAHFSLSPEVSLTEIGCVALTIFSCVLGIFQLAIILYSQSCIEEMSRLIADTTWTRGSTLYIALVSSQLFSFLLTPLLSLVGVLLLGPEFNIFSAGATRNPLGSTILTCIGWFFYAILLVSTAIYHSTKNEFVGAVSTLSMMLSLACILFSLYMYGYQQSKALENSSDDLSQTATTGTKQAASKDEKKLADMVDHPDELLDNAASAIKIAGLQELFNGQMATGFAFSVASFVLRVTLDLSKFNWWGAAQVPTAQLFFVSFVCYLISVPLIHYSGQDKGVPVFKPFSGSGVFIAMQVLGWATYALFVSVTIMIIVMLNTGTAGYTKINEALRHLLSFHFWYTMVGVLQFIPAVLISISISVEVSARRRITGMQTMALEAFQLIRNIVSEEAQHEEVEASEKEVLQLAFRLLVEPSLKYYEIPYQRRMLQIYVPPGSPQSGDEDEDDMDSPEQRRLQENATVIVILLCCASASFYLMAAFTAGNTVLALAFAVCAVIVTTSSCVGLHVGYGYVCHGNKVRSKYTAFMPFRGGSTFVLYQMAGWCFFALALLVTLIAAMEYEGVSAAVMTAAAVLSVLSQSMILKSVPHFSTDPHKPSYLEQNGEGILAVLVSSAAFLFGNTYDIVRAFFSPEPSARFPGYQSFLGETSKRRTRVPFVVILLGISISIPSILIALSRSTVKLQKFSTSHRRKARRAKAEEASKDDTLDRLANVFRSFVEVSTLLLAPLVSIACIYGLVCVFNNFTPDLASRLEGATPYVLYTIVALLLLSLVPYLVDVQVPAFVIVVRFTLITWMQYGLPVVVGFILAMPRILYPSLGTQLSVFALLYLVVLGGVRQARLVLKLGVYASMGYRSYQEYLQFRAHEPFQWSYVVDMFIFAMWTLYLPLYEGHPQITGTQRSERFTRFMRKYVFGDVERYFNFKIIISDKDICARDDKDPRKYLFSFHPHGVFPGTALFCSLTEQWRQRMGYSDVSYLSTHVASIVFNVPGVRDYNLRLGALSVSRKGLEASLQRGNSVLIVTGGQAEMLHTQVSKKVMTLVTHHIGFVRMAITQRVPLVPLLCMAEHNVMGLVHFPRIQKFTLKLLGFPFPIFPLGRFGLPLPFRTPLTLIVGKAIEIPEGASADNPEDVQKLSDTYFAAVKELFYKYRVEAGYPEMELNLVNDKKVRAEKRRQREVEKEANKKK